MIKNQYLKRGWICQIVKKDDLYAYDDKGKTLCITITNNNMLGGQITQVIYLYPEDTKQRLPTHVPIMIKNTRMIARCEYIQSIDRDRFLYKIGKITDKEQNELNKGLLLSLGIDTNDNTRIFDRWEYYAITYELFEKQFKKQPNTINCRQYQIYYIAENKEMPPKGREMQSNRPGIIISNNAINRRSSKVMIIYLTSAKKTQNIMSHVRVKSGSITGIALCEQIFTVDKTQIKFKIGELNKDEQDAIKQSIRHRLGIKNDMDIQTKFQDWEKQFKKGW